MSRSPAARRQALVLVLLLGLLAGLSPAHAADPDTLRRELAREEARAEELAERIRTVERELAATRTELASLQARLEQVTAQLLAAQERETRALEDAELARRQAQHARRQVDDAQAELTANDDQLALLARDTYKYGAPRSSVVSVVGSASLEGGPGELSDAMQYLDRGIGRFSVLVERSGALLVRVDAARARAEQERQRREDLLAEASAARDEVAEAHASAADLVSEASLAEHRQEQLVAELADARAAAQRRIGDLETRIVEEERRLEEERRRREEEARRRAEEERRRAAEAEARRRAEAQARERQQAQARQRQQAQASRQAAPAPAPRSSGPAPSTTIVDRGGGLVTVGGITVAASLGPSLQALLDAARADGIVLGGHGWRSVESQVALRIANGCRDVYTSPASSCRIPTAIPGSSEHERGLAIDFTWQGRTICYPLPANRCHGNAAFDWLRANAHRYGLRNLPSEAWHWSTTGR